jgi:hypothetical protein
MANSKFIFLRMLDFLDLIETWLFHETSLVDGMKLADAGESKYAHSDIGREGYSSMANSKFIFLRMLDFLDLIDLAPVPGEVSHGREGINVGSWILVQSWSTSR